MLTSRERNLRSNLTDVVPRHRARTEALTYGCAQVLAGRVLDQCLQELSSVSHQEADTILVARSPNGPPLRSYSEAKFIRLVRERDVHHPERAREQRRITFAPRGVRRREVHDRKESCLCRSDDMSSGSSGIVDWRPGRSTGQVRSGGPFGHTATGTCNVTRAEDAALDSL